MIKVGFIDYFLDEWHANNYPKMIHEASNGEVEAVYAYGMIPTPKTGKTTDEWCAEHGLTKCETIEELVEKSDGIIVLSPDNSEMHYVLSEYALKSGKPVFIDKTFATGLEMGKQIFDLAAKYDTPVYSTSSLRFAEEYQAIDKSQITAMNCLGPNGLEIYAIHMLEPMIMLMQKDAERVMFVDGERYYSVVIEFTDGRKGIISGFMGRNPYVINIAGPERDHFYTAEGNGYFLTFIKELVEYFKDRRIRVPHEQTLAIMAILSAAKKSRDNGGEWVKTEEKFLG